jgi:predicted aldo/keto reductase-like oxidoreductase
LFRKIPEAEAATVDAAWQQGIRYFDTAPLYGAGLSEMRVGRALAKHKRGQHATVDRGQPQVPRHRPAGLRVDSRPLA